MNDKSEASPAWLRPAADYGPLVLFFGAYMLSGLMAATAVIVVTSLLALALTWFYERRVPLMPLVTAAVVSVFGGLTLWLQDETFIKMKPTIIYVLFAAILGGGLCFGRALFKPLLGSALQLEDEGWNKLTLRWAIFFLLMAVLNEVVWRTQDNQTWVVFKTFVNLPITLVFVACQFPLLQKHSLEQN